MLAIVLVLAFVLGRYLARGWLTAVTCGLLAVVLASVAMTAVMSPHMILQVPSIMMTAYKVAFENIGPLALIDPILGVLASLGGYFAQTRRGARNSVSGQG